MRLAAIWSKDGKEIHRVSPVMNIVCEENMTDIAEIEVEDNENWYSSEMLKLDADDFAIVIER